MFTGARRLERTTPMSTESSIPDPAAATAATATATATSTTSDKIPTPQEKRFRSIFDVPSNFFDGCCLLSSSTSSISTSNDKSNSNVSDVETKGEANKEEEQSNSQNGAGAAEFSVPRWTCNTCKAEFECLNDQRLHFKSDIHRINVKLSIAGKDIVNEEDFDEDSFKDCDISSVSGSEDEAEKDSVPRKALIIDSVRQQKLCFFLETEERVSVWKCLLVNEHESVSFENNKASSIDCGGSMRYLRENEVIERLKFVTHESRDKTHLRIVLLASGGHFAGCVFDGNSVVAHKTFHRYVVRAKAGKKQSSKDGAGRYAHSAGASLRRYNELALKKDVQELLAAWKPYFDASSCIFFHAPSSNRQLFFDGDKAYFSHQHSAVRNVPMSVRRPTLKEARRIYNQLTQVAFEVDEMKIPPETKEVLALSTITITDVSSESIREGSKENMKGKGNKETSVHQKESEEPLASGSESEALGTTTPLHEAAKSGDAHKVLELLEQGLDPCIKDEKGRTPYILANEKEVRDSFRRFMASNLDMWDWRAANVPSALTKEMEESQAAKQAEKEAKRKARAKELKKLRKAKEKKAQAEAVASQNAAALTGNRGVPIPLVKGQSRSSGGSQISKEEEMKRAQAAERERRAAAAERRMVAAAAAAGQGSGGASSVPSTGQSASGLTSDIICSCCNASLAGKVPFHRYNYKYCSTSCMHVHREILEDG